MAGANLSDDVALGSVVDFATFRVLLTAGFLGRVEALDLPGCAAAAGISEAQARQFIDGEMLPPPHQGLVLMAAVYERHRLHLLARRESAIGTSVPAASESSAAGAQAAVDQLAAEFPGWRFSLPPGVRDFGTERPAKLVWAATHDRLKMGVTGVSAAELRGKVQLHEADWATEAKRFAAYMKG